MSSRQPLAVWQVSQALKLKLDTVSDRQSSEESLRSQVRWMLCVNLSLGGAGKEATGY